MRRYTFFYMNLSRSCFFCAKNGAGLQTDRQTGEEYPVCEKHIKTCGSCQKRQLHLDFKKSLKFSNNPCITLPEKTIVGAI